MAVKLLNDFLLGADPELVLLNPPDLVNGSRVVSDSARNRGSHFWGFDHNGFVLEPHPVPNKSARGVCKAIKDSLDTIAFQFDGYRQRAGAFVETPQREVTLGGHVHLDLPTLNREQIEAMDVFATSLEHLEILPSSESKSRRAGGSYGRLSDVRSERGRVEYRSLCSWLFSRKASMLSITGIKLCAIAPRTLTKMTSIPQMQKWFEGFKGQDDDVDWILDRGYFESSLEAKPDTSVPSVWKADAEKGKELLRGINQIKSATSAVLRDLESRVRQTQAAAHLSDSESVDAYRQALNDFMRAQRQAQHASQAAVAGGLRGLQGAFASGNEGWL